ncbi:L-ribulokinase [Aequitasia blattaphilus]|uniref:Ribulokinase n=1 Tax=Aequitasia blattaphilus TaxID=2949332 RepID=A0ABT1E8E9_9FIRM|nr:ribulokinase [Aequitasia blattaphilus]MCP1102106.1 ribulokinase [Aequitasia blattaphilus]MCR8614746.1 ribulokinase [Aequitasia blattaphilus]
MKDKYTIGLDYGTLSGRGILVRCSDGEVIGCEAKEYPHGVMTEKLPNGDEILPSEWCLEHPKDYLDVLEDVIVRLIQKSNVDKEDIIAIGVDFTACTVLPIDEDGLPLCMKKEFSGKRNAYVKLWKHHGAQKQADYINQVLEKLNLSHSARFGGSVSPEVLIPKVLETIEEDIEIYEKSAEILEAGDWITRIITGSHKRSCSMAAYKAWWNQEDGYPDTELYKSINPRIENIVQEKLTEDICGIGEEIGTLSKEWAAKLGLVEGIPVAPAIIDSHAGVPGSGVRRETQAMLVLGTSSVIVGLSRNPFSHKGIYGAVKDAIVPGYYALESGLAAVGDLFGWFANNCIPANYYDEAQKKNVDVFDLLNEKAECLERGGTGLLVLDWWNGNKTPYVDGNLAGAIIGLTLNTKPEEIYLALIESTAFGTKVILDLYKGAGVKIDEIVVSGGIALKNPTLMQVYADVLGIDLKLAKSSQAAALGSAIYATLAAGSKRGGYDDYQEAVMCMSEVKSQIYHFNLENKTKYDKLYKVYQKYSSLIGQEGKKILHELHMLKKF